MFKAVTTSTVILWSNKHECTARDFITSIYSECACYSYVTMLIAMVNRIR